MISPVPSMHTPQTAKSPTRNRIDADSSGSSSTASSRTPSDPPPQSPLAVPWSLHRRRHSPMRTQFTSSPLAATSSHFPIHSLMGPTRVTRLETSPAIGVPPTVPPPPSPAVRRFHTGGQVYPRRGREIATQNQMRIVSRSESPARASPERPTRSTQPRARPDEQTIRRSVTVPPRRRGRAPPPSNVAHVFALLDSFFGLNVNEGRGDASGVTILGDFLGDPSTLDIDELVMTTQFDAARRPTLSEDMLKCTICLEEFQHLDKQSFLPCSHTFHSKCIFRWLKRSILCPICQTNVKTLSRSAQRWDPRKSPPEIDRVSTADTTTPRWQTSTGRAVGRESFSRVVPEPLSRPQSSDSSTRPTPFVQSYSRRQIGESYSRLTNTEPFSRRQPYSRIQATESHSRAQTSETQSRIQQSEIHSRIQPAESHLRVQPTEFHSRTQQTEPHLRMQPIETHLRMQQAESHSRPQISEFHSRPRRTSQLAEQMPRSPELYARPVESRPQVADRTSYFAVPPSIRPRFAETDQAGRMYHRAWQERARPVPQPFQGRHPQRPHRVRLFSSSSISESAD